MKVPRFFISLFLLFSYFNSVFFSAEIDQNQSFCCGCYKQWFAGPLFTPNPTTALPGHPIIESVIIVSDTFGKYDSSWHLHSSPNLIGIIPYVDFQIGITERIGFEIIGLATKNFCKGATYCNFKDTILRLGYQIAKDIPHTKIPDFRILFQETLPTGNYQKLKPKKFGTDSTGQGSYQTGIHLVTQKLFYAETKHPFRMRGDFGYFFQSSVRVKGLNYYGGGKDTVGIVHPGKYFTIFLFGEYALSETWAMGCELNYQQGGKGRFLRKRGIGLEVHSFNQFTVYPELQHTISNNSAIILGGIFTAAGKNTTAFSSILLSFLHLF